MNNNIVANADKTQPFAQWQEVDVTFPAIADTDVVVEHSLAPPTVDHINYRPQRKDRAADVYHDTSATRKQWQTGYILLRSNVANAKMTLLLWVSHGERTLAF